MTVTLAELRERIFLQRLDELVRELLGREIGDARVRIGAEDGVPDRMHQVGLAEASLAVEEEGIVGLRGRLSDRQSRRVGHLVVRPDNEGLERVAGVERAGARAAFIVSGWCAWWRPSRGCA